MIEILLIAGLAAPGTSVYETQTLHAIVAVANDRIIDGIPYSDGNGVLSGALLYSRPSGVFVTTELAVFNGDGNAFPDASVTTLETAAGWRFERSRDVLSLTVLDYRSASDGASNDHQGVALGYRRGRFSLEYAIERDKSYYHRPYDYFLQFDVERAAASWTGEIGEAMTWTAGIGTRRIDTPDERNDFVTAGVAWQWQELDWQATVIHPLGDFEGPGGIADEPQLLLRVAKPFRL